MEHARYRILVNGIVQGVGFRPFVYKLAGRHSLSGFVKNTPEGVLIEAEGSFESLRDFVSRLTSEAPSLAIIETLQVEELPTGSSAAELLKPQFTILQSEDSTSPNTLISPDIAICEDCSRELFDPRDQRYLYPFINCTNCGPRYTIVCDVPYDRHHTTMKDFLMCPECGAQYREPLDRRYHAQPVCCAKCGPEVSLLDADGNPVKAASPAAGQEAMGADISVAETDAWLIVRDAARLLAQGKILAVKSLGGYHLVCDAGNEAAVLELRSRKHRDEKPFALMARDVPTIMKYCMADEEELKILKSPASPIVLLRRKQGTGLTEQLAPGNPDLGMMLPYTPLQLLLFFSEDGKPSDCPELLVMTSGNRSSEPICFEDQKALYQLKGIADYFLLNNRLIRTRTDDSVVRLFRGEPHFIRRSRGYAPSPVTIDASVLPSEQPAVLAVGGELKNTFCMSKGNRFFLSQHIGDLENMETLQAFEDGIRQYQRLFDTEPAVVAYDLHPGYLSTEYALALNDIEKIPVQHHHAHVASCMAENGLTGDVIGIAFDGTGYGEDGTIWGGEVFTGSYKRFERAAHLQQFRLPGSEAAVREPWRSAAACLALSGFDLGDLEGLRKSAADERLLKGVTPERVTFLAEMLEKSVNSPVTSSMGRLFDAVAAMIGIRTINAFEGQAAMELEAVAATESTFAAFVHATQPDLPYPFSIRQADGSYELGITGMMRAILTDLADGKSSSHIAARFHHTVAAMAVEVCEHLRKERGLDRVVLSGGVFQNMLLLGNCVDRLTQRGFRVFTHRKVPANDGGISLGQAVIAMARTAGF